MSGFSPTQLKKLTGKLDRSHVQSRSVEGRSIDYIEGWFALSEANAIFGFANWDRETVHFERLFERTRGEMTTCSYSARARVRVRAGSQTISREGTGCGTASARNAGDAHERAIKAAETDATKRALATFGNRFGLCLYDKDQAGVSEPSLRCFKILCPDGQVFAADLSPEAYCTGLRKIMETTTDSKELAAWHTRNTDQIVRLRTLAPNLKTQRGEHYADVLERLFKVKAETNTEPKSDADTMLVAAVSSDGIRMTTEPAGALIQLTAIDGSSSTPLEPVTTNDPSLCHDQSRLRERCAGSADQPAGLSVDAIAAQRDGLHVLVESSTDIADGPLGECVTPPFFRHDLRENCQTNPAHVLAPSRIAWGPRIDKTSLAIATPRRIRDKAHLRHVGTLPCLVCNSLPSHPHHLTFAQRRGLSLKVSDEFVVPLCAEHHNELHRSGSERLWWNRRSIEPLRIAKKLWESRTAIRLPHPS